MKKIFTSLLTFAFLAVAGTSWAQTDVTSKYIKNANLASLDGWTAFTSATGNVFNSTVQGNNTEGYATEAYAGWGSLEKEDYSLTQKITLPAGKYQLVNYSFFRYGGGITLMRANLWRI